MIPITKNIQTCTLWHSRPRLCVNSSPHSRGRLCHRFAAGMQGTPLYLLRCV